MIRVATSVPKNVVADPIGQPLVLAAGGVANPSGSGQNIGVDVLLDIKSFPGVEFAARYVQNVGANPCNYAFGQDCLANVFHGQLAAGQQLNASDIGQRINVFSALGTSIVVATFRRNDLGNHGNVLPTKLP